MRWASSKIVAFGLFLFVQVAQADWTPAKRLTWNLAWSGVPNLAIDSSNTIHVVWEDDISGNREIYYTRSTDEGITWSAAQRLTWNSGECRFPAIAIDGSDTIHVVWEDDTPGNHDIYYTRSADKGLTWSAAQRLTWNSGGSYNANLAIDGSGTIHVVWDDDTPGNFEIYYRRSSDGGATWSAAKRLTWNSGESRFPAIAIDGSGTIHIVWDDNTPGSAEIYYKGSTDGGSTWSPAKRLTWTSGGSYDAVLAIESSNTIHVVWFDFTPGNVELYYKRSSDGGATWSAASRLTSNSGGSYCPAIARDGSDAIHVVWEDQTPGFSEIYYKKSTDGGTTWSQDNRLTWNSGTSADPVIAIDTNSIIHVVWFDHTPGNPEIYYKNGN